MRGAIGLCVVGFFVFEGCGEKRCRSGFCVVLRRRGGPNRIFYFLFFLSNVTLITPKEGGGGYANHSRCIRPKKP